MHLLDRTVLYVTEDRLDFYDSGTRCGLAKNIMTTIFFGKIGNYDQLPPIIFVFPHDEAFYEKRGDSVTGYGLKLKYNNKITTHS